MREGSTYTNILSLIKEHGYNKDVHVVAASVVNASPLTISVNGMQLTSEDFLITETASKAAFAQGDRAVVIIDNNNIFLIDKVVAQ